MGGSAMAIRVLSLGLALSLWTLPPALKADSPNTPAPQWSQFRGPGGQGAACDSAKLPVEFGPSKNVLWKTPLPRGNSSACVWGDRIFVTGAETDTRRLITVCVDRETGKTVWERSVTVEKLEPLHQL